jgi:hypothetical protein
MHVSVFSCCDGGVSERLLIASNNFPGADGIVKDGKAFAIRVDRYRRPTPETTFGRIFACTDGSSFLDDI